MLIRFGTGVWREKSGIIRSLEYTLLHHSYFYPLDNLLIHPATHLRCGLLWFNFLNRPSLPLWIFPSIHPGICFLMDLIYSTRHPTRPSSDGGVCAHRGLRWCGGWCGVVSAWAGSRVGSPRGRRVGIPEGRPQNSPQPNASAPPESYSSGAPTAAPAPGALHIVARDRETGRERGINNHFECISIKGMLHKM